MKKNPIGGLLVVLAVCILALTCGIVGGTQHLGQDVSKQILPTSLTSSPDTVSKIDESTFNATLINAQLYTVTTKKVSTTPKKTYTQSNYTKTNSSSTKKNSSSTNTNTKKKKTTPSNNKKTNNNKNKKNNQ